MEVYRYNLKPLKNIKHIDFDEHVIYCYKNEDKTISKPSDVYVINHTQVSFIKEV